ncbi:folylpolyglutamate synthase/dihydrofolate synthase family protein [uncultured Eubacterium sp.]|uniref:bifunctional folylpolyglutamate synthase/dihydrofolate synthase n=1 Tax=uncultured Eubacterium sp. TaxID=165185 RepID=UPI002591BC39|nr:folylpolyglutamate synthase/dihydrofolate synthase family protein [uncultured Eubacterium sp.]
MNYSEAREYLKNVNKLGSILGLNTIKELLKRLGNPQNELKVVHIAGTNGKGSIMTFVQNILMESGYKVGRYCSPAVFNEREIIRINDEYISEEQSADLLTRIKEKCDSMYSEGLPHPTSFEIETAEALMFFEEQNCDIALIECGMGGETDATNVFEKVLCSVIATISLDHTQFLGSTIEEIAKVKSGIIKENCPVVMSKQTVEAENVIKKVCKQKNSELIIPNEQDFENVEIDGLTTKVTYKASNNKEYILNLQVLGTYQIKNAKTAVEVALVIDKALTEKTNICDESDKNNSTGMKNNINNSGNTIEKNIKKGIEKTVWPGRMEVISKEPLIIIDGAHNPGAVLELRKTLDLYFTNKRITFIMGVLSDKDFSKEAEIIADRAERIITITPNNSRGLDGHKLAETLVEYNHNVQVADSLKQAAKESIDTIKENRADMILAFGSLSYLGELKQVVRLICNH